MKKGALVLAVTNDLIFSAANVIIGVNKHSPDLFQDVILFVDCKNKLNRYEVAALNSIIDKEQNLFIYDAEELFPKVNHQDERLKNFIGKYSKMPLVKLMIPNLFWDCQYTGTNEYEYILWLDSDICIVEDFSSILKFNGLSACLGSFAKPLLKKPENFPEISDTDIKPNGGMILFKKQDFEITKLGRNEYNEEIAKIIDKLLSDGALGIEELALTVFAKRKNIHLNIIPSEYNTLPKFSKNLNPKIVHALGKELKFWNNPIINIAYPEWNKNNEKWLQALMYAGVSAGDIVKYNKSKYDSGSLSNLIQRFEWIDYWSALMDRIQFSNQKIYQQTNISSRYVQFYFKGLQTKDIHYEIIKEKNNTFTIALHFERGCASSNSKLVAFLKKISDDNKWEFVNKNNLMAISMKNIREIPLVAAKITELVSKTFDDVLKLVIE